MAPHRLRNSFAAIPPVVAFIHSSIPPVVAFIRSSIPPIVVAKLQAITEAPSFILASRLASGTAQFRVWTVPLVVNSILLRVRLPVSGRSVQVFKQVQSSMAPHGFATKPTRHPN